MGHSIASATSRVEVGQANDNPSAATSVSGFDEVPRYENWTREQRDEFRRTHQYPKFSREQLGYREVPDPGPQPNVYDQNTDGSYRFWEGDQHLEAKYNQAVADWAEKNEQAMGSLKVRLKETAEEHGVEQQVIHDTAQKFWKNKALAPLVGYVGSSPEFTELMVVLRGCDFFQTPAPKQSQDGPSSRGDRVGPHLGCSIAPTLTGPGARSAPLSGLSLCPSACYLSSTALKCIRL